MKKKLILSLFIAFLISLLTVPALANQVTDIDVNVTLNKDGSATIEQVWSGYFDEGTECYYPFITRNKNYIRNFTVTDDLGVVYANIGDWDVEASFEQKADRCGLNEIDGGYEVCWGISEYGNRRYVIRYTVTNVVGSYADSDGFNFRFVNEGMNTTPTSATVTVKAFDGTDITDDNCNIWAFGYNGSFVFEDGYARAQTNADLDYDNHITLMMEFDKGIFSPSYTSQDSFETVKEAAFDGSDYRVVDSTLIILLIVIGIAALIVIAVLIHALIVKLRIKRFYKSCDYYRDVPDNIDMSYALLYSVGYCKESSIIGTRILKLVQSGAIEPQAQKGAFKEKAAFKIVKRKADGSDHRDRNLYDILDAAAGEDDLLVPGEMKKYCDKNPQKLRGFLDKSYDIGIARLNEIGFYKKRTVPIEIGKTQTYRNIKNYSDAGKAELAKLFGLKKYLEDFSLIAERETGEVFIWQDYLVYATLFGIADKVLDSLKKVYPESIREIEQYSRDITFSDSCRMYMYSSMSRREQIQAARASGSGGSASFGGGGGFSGGGFGGGTR